MGALDERVAIVTGAGRGIGRSEALLLAEEGAAVVINDVDKTNAAAAVEAITAAGGRASFHVGDASEWEQGEALVNQAIADFGRLDILVNNAGILRDAMSFNMTEDDWDAVIKVHLKGHFVPSHFAAAYWRQQAKAGREVHGRVVNTASEAGLHGSAGQLNYGTAKAGIAAMGIILARELGKYGVTVNVIAPRALTAMTQDIFPEMDVASGDFNPFAPENVAPLVAWLASDDAADVTGQVFVVYGGLVQLMEGWTPAARIDKGGRWTIAELSEQKSQLFAGRERGVPGFPT